MGVVFTFQLIFKFIREIAPLLGLIGPFEKIMEPSLTPAFLDEVIDERSEVLLAGFFRWRWRGLPDCPTLLIRHLTNFIGFRHVARRRTTSYPNRLNCLAL